MSLVPFLLHNGMILSAWKHFGIFTLHAAQRYLFQDVLLPRGRSAPFGHKLHLQHAMDHVRHHLALVHHVVVRHAKERRADMMEKLVLRSDKLNGDSRLTTFFQMSGALLPFCSMM